MTRFNKLSLIAATCVLTAWAVPRASATEPPADLCSLLPAADVSKTLGRAYGAPQESVAPRPAPNAATGTDCNYLAKGSKLWFRVYFDPSASVAADVFSRFSKLYGKPAPVAGLGDEAYFDQSHGIHVRKGKVRFYINLDPIDNFTPAVEKQLKDLAGDVIGRL
jgi:hypothetical protein